MALSFDYLCDGCLNIKTNLQLDSFMCDCGGTYRFTDIAAYRNSCFEPHYDPTIGNYVTSWRDMERKGKNFVNERHPKGLIVTDPKNKFMREMKKVHKYKEDYNQEVYAKDGIKYKPGRGWRMDDKKGDFVRGKSTYVRKYF